MSGLSLAEVGPSAADVLLAIERASGTAAFSHIFSLPFPDDDVRTRWLAFDGRVLLAAREVPVGFVAFKGAVVYSLYVVPEEWGKGAGPELHDRAVGEIARGHDTAKLWVLEQNLRARRFYERRGWRDNGEREAVPYPPHPVKLGYSLDLSGR